MVGMTPWFFDGDRIWGCKDCIHHRPSADGGDGSGCSMLGVLGTRLV